MTAAGRIAALTLLVLTLAPGGKSAVAPQPGPADWAGVYKVRFDNALVSGEHYRSENILEIAAYSKDAAYVRLHLEFANGHQCVLWGVADQVGPALVYRAAPDGADRPCVLTLKRAGGRLTLADEGGVCRLENCGARGVFEGVGFPVSARRPIRYLPRLKASSEYKDAVAAYRARSRAPG